MSTFMLKNKQLDFTPVSNIFIEKYMPKARGEFIKVYLLMLKYNTCGEIGVTSSILATSLNLLESDVLNALNYWNDEGLIKLIPIDKMGNFNIEFVDLVKESKSQSKEINLLQALNKNSTKDMLNDIERLLGRPLSPKEMTTYLSWQDDFNFSSELILILFYYIDTIIISDDDYFSFGIISVIVRICPRKFKRIRIIFNDIIYFKSRLLFRDNFNRIDNW